MTEKIQKLMRDVPSIRWTALVLLALRKILRYFSVVCLNAPNKLKKANKV